MDGLGSVRAAMLLRKAGLSTELVGPGEVRFGLVVSGGCGRLCCILLVAGLVGLWKGTFGYGWGGYAANPGRDGSGQKGSGKPGQVRSGMGRGRHDWASLDTVRAAMLHFLGGNRTRGNGSGLGTSRG